MRVLLVWPPFLSPWAPYLSVPALSAYVKEQGIAEVLVRDLNIEFFDYMTSGRFHGVRPDGDGADGVYWQSVEAAKQTLRSREKFSADEGTLLEALGQIDLALQEASSRFGSTRIRFLGAQHQTPRIRPFLFPHGPCLPWCEMEYSPYSSEEVRGAVEDTGQNPFLCFYRDAFVSELSDLNPDLVGISLAFPQQVIPAFTLARLIKEQSPHVHVCLGGAQLSKLSSGVRRSEMFHNLLLPLVDAVVLGEGEEPLERLIRAIRGGDDLSSVPNLAFRRGRGVVMTGPTTPVDMAALPTPDYRGMPLSGYLNSGSFPAVPLQVTRGCYWGKCAFCDSVSLLGHYRVRPMERVLDDIQAMEERHGIHHVHFSDEAVPPKVILQLADFIVERRLPTRWGGYARFERTFTPEFCARIAKGGCSVLFMGLEAAAPRVSRLMNKGVDPSLAHRILKSLQEAGVQVHLCTVIGFPGETREEARETFDFLMENRHLYESYSCMPFVLEKNSAVARNPERFGVTRLVDDIHDDLRPHYWYEVATGLSMEETGSLYQEFNERLAAAGAYNPIFV